MQFMHNLEYQTSENYADAYPTANIEGFVEQKIIQQNLRNDATNHKNSENNGTKVFYRVCYYNLTESGTGLVFKLLTHNDVIKLIFI